MPMRRFANPPVWLGALLLASSSVACGSGDPAPQNVTQERRGKTAKDPADEEKPSPFSNPDKEPPGPRSGKLPEPEAVAKLVADAQKQIDAGRIMPGVAILRRCANKVPPSVACEAAIGMALSTTRKHRAYARYYMAQAAEIDDPAVGADTYRALAKAAHDDSQFATEASALSVVVARDEATADDYSALGGALSADPARRPDAAEAYRKAYEADATRYEDLRKQAVLLAQVGREEEAISAFEEYLEKAGAHSPHKAGVENRLDQLRARQGKKAP